MTAFERSFPGVVGDHADLEITVPGIPSGQSLTKAWLTVKVDEDDADPGVLQKVITTTPTSAGQITDNGAGDLTGVVLFTLAPAETILVGTAERPYDVQVQLANGKVTTVEKGVTRFVKGVTAATS